MLATRIKGGSSPAAASGSSEGDRSGPAGLANPGKESSQQPLLRDLQSVIEKLPSLSLADLKPGEIVILSCTNNEDPSRVTAITLLAGAEPVLRSSSRGGQTLNLGSWNLDLNMNLGVP